MTAHRRPDLVLLLYADRSEPVSSMMLGDAARFGREVLAISLDQLVNEVEVGAQWHWAGRTIDPARTAVVNRLTSLDKPDAAGSIRSPYQRTQLSLWLREELQRFAYASSLPSINAAIGGYGSLIDQWLDLPLMVDGLRVPAHQTPWNKAPLTGDVHLINPWSLYSLGRPAGETGATPKAGEVAFVRPEGLLVHVAQVGGMFLLANVPPGMTRLQHDCVTAFARSMATSSGSRILEHAFFVGRDVPVFYATFPIPMITGSMPEYRDLLVQGLRDDFERYSRRAAA